ncbi:MAG: DNA polymerase III subunit beta [Blastomonas sp.]|uniref:DNA polymerase III subunit beta n=1 Tax=Blastomonas sp. TaxID=1909299 RepID=UPI00406A9CCE|nr:DNA polymerase III subunit beta [Blastomonas sp.]
MARGDNGTVAVATVSLASGSLKAALKSVIAAVEARNTIPILANVLISVTREHLTVTAPDLDIELTRQVPVGQSSGSWAITVQGRVLDAAVQKLPKESEVTLQLQDGRLIMRCGRARFSFPTLPVDDFPRIACLDWAAQWEMEGAGLAEALAHVRPAMSAEETRYYLNGVQFERRADEDSAAALFVVATDGNRLHHVRLPAPEGSETLADSIVPRKAVPIIQTLCAESRVDVAFAPGKMRVEAGETVLVSKLIDGNFPDWRRVLPTGATSECRFDPRALEDALGRVIAISNDKTRAVKLEFGASSIELSCTCPETGTASETIEAEGNWTGLHFAIGFNGRFLADVLAQLPGDSATVRFSDSTGPTGWSKGDASDRACVLMPMRV